MKKFCICTIWMSAVFAVSPAQNKIHTFHVKKAGQLQAEMTREEAHNITHMKISGRLNAHDFQLMRDSMNQLEFLDLREATIAAMSGKGGTAAESFTFYTTRTLPEHAFCKKISTEKSPNEPAPQYIGKQSLREIWLPDNLFNIDKYAFYNCRNLRLVVCTQKKAPNLFPNALNDSLTTLFVPLGSHDTYKNKDRWKNFNILEGTPIRSNIRMEKTGTLGDLILQTGNQPSEVNYLTISGNLDETDFKLIRDFMPKLVAIDLQNAVFSHLPDYTFSQKRYLTEVLLPPTLHTIGSRAFSGCVHLGPTLTLPAEVSSIGDGAFLDCNILKEVIITGKKLNVIGKNLFRNDQNRLLYMPQ